MSAPSSRRNAAFLVAMVAGLVIVAELLAHVGLAWMEGGWQSPARRAVHQQTLAGSAEVSGAEVTGTERPAQAAKASANDLPPADGLPLALHPFSGYLRDPAKPNAFYDVADDGFFAPRGRWPSDGSVAQPDAATDPPPFVIAIFGGSLANHVAFSGAPAISRRVAAAIGRPVVVRSLALGGFKQPQQLTTLAYLQARGTHFDVVVNLDGFNELALPFNNLRANVDPTYPVHWAPLAGVQDDADTQRTIGAVAYLADRRASRAAAAAGPWRRYCATCQLLWRAGDRRLEDRVAALRLQLAEKTAQRRTFQSHGPPIVERTRDARLAELVALWQRSSRQMHALTHSMGALYLHALQPNQYLPGSKPLSAEERRIAFAPDIHHRPLVAAGYPMMSTAGEALRADGVRFHDLTGLFRNETATLYNDTCCHLNRPGNLRVAAALADLVIAALAEQGLTGPSDVGVAASQ